MKAVIKYFEQFKPKIKRQKNGLFSFLHIPIFATHERKDESPMTIDAEWMQRCVADQKELKDKFHRLPKVGVGHNDEESGQEKPAVFFLDNFQFDPKTGFLYADYVDVPEQWRDELTSNRWPNRSCEPSMTVPRIEYMALLGGRPGWLKALPDIHYAERTNKFKEILMPRAKYAELSEEIKQAIQSAVKSSLDGLLEELGADGVSGAAEPYEEGNDEVTKLKADAQKQADERGFAEKPKEGNPGDDPEGDDKRGKDAEDDARSDPDEDDESEDSLREKLMKHAEAEYKEMSREALKAMWSKVSGAGVKRKKDGRYPRTKMKGNWSDEDEKGHYAEQLQRTRELELEVEKLKASQRDQERARDRSMWRARYAELRIPPGRLDVVKQVDHIMKLPTAMREEHFKAVTGLIGMPSESALVDGGFATYSESVGAGKEVDAGAMDKFIRENIQRFGGDAVAAGRAFMEQNS